MNFPFYIARRYLFSKKSHNAINIISMVSVCGIVIATMALVCSLSVYNGFSGLVASFFSEFDPQLKITPRTGKAFDRALPAVQAVKALPEVAVFSEVVQDNALVRFNDRQVVAVVKGVSDNYEQLAEIDSTIIDGNFLLREDVVDYATLGAGVAYALGTRAGFASPLELYAPRRNEPVNLANPAASFNREYAQVGAVFRINQPVYDENYVLVPLALARDLFGYETEVTSVELRLAEGADTERVQRTVEELLGSGFVVKNRYQQQEAAFKMVEIEKWMTFLILCFILTIALFNIVGSLSMLIIEKKDDVRTLRTMGAGDALISRIFLFEGWMISGFGALIGIGIGLVLCLLQQELGLLKLGQTAGEFIIDAYPVEVRFTDVLAVFLTVTAIGFLAAWYPVRYLSKKWLRAGEE